jgi:hypothetical protein
VAVDNYFAAVHSWVGHNWAAALVDIDCIGGSWGCRAEGRTKIHI